MALRVLREHLDWVLLGGLAVLAGLLVVPVPFGKPLAGGILGAAFLALGVASVLGAARASVRLLTGLQIAALACFFLSGGAAFLAWAAGGNEAAAPLTPAVVASVGLVCLASVGLVTRRDIDPITRLCCLLAGPIGAWLLWAVLGSPSP